MSQNEHPGFFFARAFRKRASIRWFSAAVVTFSISVLLTACEKVDGSKAQKVPLVAPHGVRNTGETDLPMPFTKGMAYADLRALATKQGWTPVVDAECKSNVMGSNYQQLCSSEPDSTLCTVCDASPELSGCSGDGYCGMYFAKDGLTLHVVTYGMIEDLKVSGRASRLKVDGWDMSQQR